jgi:hypothetical protein
VNDHLSVVARGKAVAPSGQIPAKLGKIINLPVAGKPDIFPFIAKGLRPGSQIDNAKAAKANSEAWFQVIRSFIGTAVEHTIPHFGKQCRIYLPLVRQQAAKPAQKNPFFPASNFANSSLSILIV